MRRVIFFSLTTFIFTACGAFILAMLVFDSSGVPSSFDVFSIDSKVLGEKREILVQTPEEYAPEISTYPVIYVFGGNTLTFRVANDLRLLSYLDFFPEAIVVGVPNINQASRQRDLTPPFMKQDIDEGDSDLGLANSYLEYIDQELVTAIDSMYATNTKRIAIGHSREGLMVMYSMLYKPELFEAKLVLSPALWREEQLFVDSLKAAYENDELQGFLYLSMGDREVDKMKKSFEAARGLFNSQSGSMVTTSEYISNTDHQSNPLKSASAGLKAYFRQDKSIGDNETN